MNVMQKMEAHSYFKATPAASRTRGRQRRNDERALWFFLIPSLAVIVLVLLVPLGYAICMSFTNITLGGQTSRFVGLDNYLSLVSEERFWSSLIRTVWIVSAAVALEFCLGLTIAYGLYKLTFGSRSLMMMVFVPYIITPTVAALFLRWMLMGRFGLISGILIGMGFYPPDFLGSRGWAQFAVILADAWQFTPFMVLTLYAGLNTVDTSMIEAAKIDGAGPLDVLFRVMLPAIKLLIVFVLAIRFMDAFRFFDTIYVLTAGGPGTATETLTLYTYALAFRFFQVGKASALGVITLLFVATITAAMLWVVFRREGHKQ